MHLTSVPEAVLWDMDGTIIDSGDDWMHYSGVVVERHGGVWKPEDGVYIFGISSEAHAEYLREAVLRTKPQAPSSETLFNELRQYMAKAYSRPHLIPGAQEVLSAFKENGVAQALVTATDRDMVESLVRHLRKPYFDVLVCGRDAPYGKPHPAPFLLGAERLGIDIERCVIFEDSEAGLASARAAGGQVYDVGEFPLVDLAAALSR